MKKDLLNLFLLLSEHELEVDQVIDLLKSSLEVRLSTSLEKEEIDKAADYNKVMKALNKFQWSL
jgi:hypothetical protein